MGAKEEANFFDYLDRAKRKEEANEREAQAARHKEEWRRTTWAGMLIATVERTGIAPFFLALGNSFEGGEDSGSFKLASLVYKVGFISICILFVYVLGALMRMVLGEEIVVEQEVVIVEEVTKSQLKAEQRKAGKRAAQDKKKGQ